MSTHRIAVIGDIHANLPALEAALHEVSVCGADEVVFLGDLLSYGVDVAAVTERIAEICRNGRATLLRGNHDAMYLSADRERTVDYESRLPEWLRETITFTRERLPVAEFNALPFIDAYRCGSIFFSHANPFGRDDWRYLNSEEDHAAACIALRENEFDCGVFGHTHRAKVFAGGPAAFLDVSASPLLLPPEDGPFVLNAGSIGQPRSSYSNIIYVLFISVAKNEITVDFRPINYEAHAHVFALKQSGMSAQTVHKLSSFFL